MMSQAQETRLSGDHHWNTVPGMQDSIAATLSELQKVGTGLILALRAYLQAFVDFPCRGTDRR